MSELHKVRAFDVGDGQERFSAEVDSWEAVQLAVQLRLDGFIVRVYPEIPRSIRRHVEARIFRNEVS